MTRREVAPKRAAFTLIELLVVMAIIAVLVSLTAAAVFRYLYKGPELQTQSDISQMAAAIGTFQQDFNVDYVPSRMILVEQYNPATLASVQSTPGLERASITYLARIFGSRFNPQGPHDWNGDGVIDPPDTRRTLEGHHCLVFFLGGIPTADGKATTGFSTSPQFPATVGGSRRGPFFDFKSSRLSKDATNGFLVYIDAFQKKPTPQPYAYFSSAKGGYNQWGSSDCATLGLSPYIQTVSGSVTRYYNHDSFQIISAGLDGQFGAGGNVAMDLVNGAKDPPTIDNLTNFARLRLGAAQ